mgnify:CR=1 FL=1
MITHIIWDWNGTLLDDVSLNLDILNRLRQQEGLAPLSLAQYRAAFGFPIRDFYERIGFDFDKTPYEVLADRYWALYEQGVKTCPLALDALRTLAALPCTHILLSASPLAALQAQVAQFPGLVGRFARVLGTDNRLGASKTALAQGLRAEGLCPPEEMLVVGDTDHDAATAAVLGCRFVPYAGGHQANNGMSSLWEVTHVINV